MRAWGLGLGAWACLGILLAVSVGAQATKTSVKASPGPAASQEWVNSSVPVSSACRTAASPSTSASYGIRCSDFSLT